MDAAKVPVETELLFGSLGVLFFALRETMVMEDAGPSMVALSSGIWPR